MGFSHYHRFFSIVCCYLRRIFGLTREEVTGGCRNLCIEEVHNLFSSPNIISVVRRVRHMKQMRSMNLSGRHHLKELGRDGRITFKCNLED
jgi:hypothetical protein